MRDLLKQFEEYLPRWSNEKHQPIPTKKHMDRWYIAWNDFVKEELSKHYTEHVQEFKNLQLKTQDDEYFEDEYEIVEEPQQDLDEPIVEKQLSPWERVQAKRKNKQ